jgi:hypothetical protein
MVIFLSPFSDIRKCKESVMSIYFMEIYCVKRQDYEMEEYCLNGYVVIKYLKLSLDNDFFTVNFYQL